MAEYIIHKVETIFGIIHCCGCSNNFNPSVSLLSPTISQTEDKMLSGKTSTNVKGVRSEKRWNKHQNTSLGEYILKQFLNLIWKK